MHILAIVGIQTGLEFRPDVRAEILALKGQAMRGCQKLLQDSSASARMNSEVWSGGLITSAEQHRLDCASIMTSGKGSTSNGHEEEALMLYASVIMLMVQENLSGEPCTSIRHHLNFADNFGRRPGFYQASVHHKFLRNIFLYNNLLAAISSESQTLRDYGQDTTNSISTIGSDLAVPLKEHGFSMMVRLSNNRFSSNTPIKDNQWK